MKKGIIFRAKRKDNGEWVWGAYFCMHHNDERSHEHYFIIPEGTAIPLGTPLDKIQVEINPDTLGVFTKASDARLEEMLMVERKKVQEYKADVDYGCAGNFNSDYDKGYWYGQCAALDRLFSDKCLPDTPITPNLRELKPQVAEGEPKLKVGDEVWRGGCKCTIKKIEGRTAYIVFDNGATWENISRLRPCLEPAYKFEIGDIVKYRNDKIKKSY